MATLSEPDPDKVAEKPLAMAMNDNKTLTTSATAMIVAKDMPHLCGIERKLKAVTAIICFNILGSLTSSSCQARQQF
jgi:hypothetical protein